jgi:hypothetical protein
MTAPARPLPWVALPPGPGPARHRPLPVRLVWIAGTATSFYLGGRPEYQAPGGAANSPPDSRAASTIAWWTPRPLRR